MPLSFRAGMCRHTFIGRLSKVFWTRFSDFMATSEPFTRFPSAFQRNDSAFHAVCKFDDASTVRPPVELFSADEAAEIDRRFAECTLLEKVFYEILALEDQQSHLKDAFDQPISANLLRRMERMTLNEVCI